MRPAPPLVFPSSRILAGWWRQFAPLALRSLAVGHFLLHHVEALVLTERSPPLDPFAAFCLRALSLSASSAPAELEGRLHLGQQLLRRILGELAAFGFAEADDARRWRVTHAGRSFVEGGESHRTGYERRAFHFRDTPPGEFVPLNAPHCFAVTPPAGWSFDPAALRRCIDQAPDWKRRHGFPTEVRAVLTPDALEAQGEPAPWQRVVLDQAEHLVLALGVVSGDGEDGELRGFAIETRGWLLGGSRPILSMGSGWSEAFPELATGPSQEAWRGAWRTWCQNHGVPAAEAEACALNRDGLLLRVDAPGELRQRLHSANGEARRDEVWLLAGEGKLRTAARVELTV
jgi:hypothetical protein